MASHPLDSSFFGPPASAETQMDFYEEEDVDQLDSDSEVDEDPEVSSAKKGSSKKEGKRIPGQTLLPTARLESIIQADGVTGHLAMSKEASYLLSIATEEFIKRMAQAGQRQASTERRSAVNYSDMSLTTQQYQEFMFLRETIPHPMTLTEALERREMKEKEVDIDPTVLTSSTLPSMSFPASGASHSSFTSKPKGKTRMINGKEKVNGAASAGRKDNKRKRDGHDDTSGNARTSSRQNRGTRAAPRDEWPDVRPAEPVSHPSGSLLANGASPYRYARQPQWAANQTTMRSDDFIEDPHSRRVEPRYVSPPPREGGDGWNATQFTGPASGFLQQPFNRIVSNPGRTIYSQQQHP